MRSRSTCFTVLLALLLGACRGLQTDETETTTPMPTEPPTAADAELAAKILADDDLDAVLTKAKAIIRTGFNAGDGYGEVWIRDFATFIEISCEVYDIAEIEKNLLMFLRFQGDDGNIIDGFIPEKKGNVSYDYIRKESVPGYLGHKNTVETDQESSLVHAIYKYVRATGKDAILDVEVDGKTVRDRLALAFEFLLRERFSKEHGLLWGATTADWGDVQPEHSWGVVLDDNSHLAIDIYDNAMFLIALDNYLSLVRDDAVATTRWRRVREEIARNVRRHLWDAKRQKFIPHVYVDGSPFPDDFDEAEIFYHGGTAVAIQAELLSHGEIAVSLAKMVENVRASGAPTIGLTVYPPYPKGFFKNRSMAVPYSYQNGGDWTWFGGRMIQTLIDHGFVAEAYREARPMVARVLKNDGFYEWYRKDGKPAGSGTFRGSAGVLGRAIQMMQSWAEDVQKRSKSAP